MKIVFFETHKEDEEFILKNLKKTNIEVITTEEKLSMSNVNKYNDADIISVFIYSNLKKEIIIKLTKLKAILTRSTGTDHIDIDFCKKNNIVVKNVPNYGENTVAEFTFALLLDISRRITETINQTKQGIFTLNKGFDLKEKTIGIVGTGKIGAHVVRIARGFEMNTIAYDKFPNTNLNVKYVEFNELIKNSDIITLHLPLLKSTRHIINKNTIKKMKKGVILINTSRGALIDTDALLFGLESEIIKYCGLDVLESEHKIKQLMKLEQIDSLNKKELATLIKDYNILKHPRVIFTPHNAFNTLEANRRILKSTIESLKELLERAK